MKHLFLKSLLLPILLFFASCEPEQVLELDSPASVSILESGEPQSISFSTNHSWTIETSDSWCHVMPSSGDGSSNEVITVTVTCDENASFESRNTILTLRAGTKIETIIITQAPREPNSLCIDLKEDIGRDALMYLLQDGSYFVYEKRDNESIETVYYNRALKADISEGVYFIKNNIDESLLLLYKGNICVCSKVDGSTYNIALREQDGTTYYWYGVEIEEPTVEQQNSSINENYTKATDWHLWKWVGYRLLSFSVTAFTTLGTGPVGWASFVLTIQQEMIKSFGDLDDDRIKNQLLLTNSLSIVTNWTDWEKLITDKAFLINYKNGIISLVRCNI